MRILDKDAVALDLEQLGMARLRARSFPARLRDGLRRRARHRPDRLGQVDHAVRSAQRGQLRREEHHHDRGPGRVRDRRDHADPVNPKAGLLFETGLRAIVRADPDIIMVGEIRDRETAKIAVEAALTGHLVLSTLHTNDAATSITRLIEMGVEPFLVASAIDCVVAQRLVRTLCQQCKRRVILPMATLREYGYHASFDVEGYEPVGCKQCGGSGYRGRTGIYEVMTVSPEIRALALERRSASEVLELAVTQGMRRLRDDGLEKVKEGRTSVSEVARVVNSGVQGEF